jgi:ABC-type glutathione transport system ATPase component
MDGVSAAELAGTDAGGHIARMPLISVRNLRTWFPVFGGVFRRRTGEIKAVDDVSFDIGPGQTVGLVGESGSGKTTVGRTLLKQRVEASSYDAAGAAEAFNLATGRVLDELLVWLDQVRK